jgi:hypothetical protein
MPKACATVTLDERVLRAVRAQAARAGRRDSDVIEEALRRHLGIDQRPRRAGPGARHADNGSEGQRRFMVPSLSPSRLAKSLNSLCV